MPVILKHPANGSSVATAFASTPEELEEELNLFFTGGRDEVMLEHHIRGKEITIGVIEGFRNAPLYVLFPAEVHKSGQYLTHEERMTSDGFVCPARLPDDELKAIEEAAQNIFEVFGLRHFATFDFIISPTGIYFLEADSVPALHNSSYLQKALDANGIRLSDFVGHVLSLAMKK